MYLLFCELFACFSAPACEYLVGMVMMLVATTVMVVMMLMAVAVVVVMVMLVTIAIVVMVMVVFMAIAIVVMMVLVTMFKLFYILIYSVHIFHFGKQSFSVYDIPWSSYYHTLFVVLS